MPNHKSASKRQRQNIKRNARNVAFKSRMRSAIKDARTAIAEGADGKDEAVARAVKVVQQARSRNVIHASTASRYVSRLSRA